MAASGAYLLIYLYRWEWNRAIISGIFFLGAEIALATSMILVRLRRLYERLNEGLEPRADSSAARPDDEKPFAWLDPTASGFGVFVPVLMGAGFVLSAIAFVVEKVAGALSSSDAAHRDVRPAVGPRPVPSRGLVPSPSSTLVVPAAPARRRRRGVIPTVVAVTVGGLLTVAALDVLADATQDRPDPEHPGVTTVDLEIRTKELGPTVDEAAEALWAACRALLPPSMGRIDLRATAPDRQRLTLNGVIGRNARRRFVGCLEDATIDLTQARVTDVSLQPAPRGPVA